MSTPSVVLALEFRGVSSAADFAFLTVDVQGTKRTGGRNLIRIDPIAQHVVAPMTLAEQAQLLVRQQPAPPDLILAYCGTAALGLHIAALTGAPAMLIDPYAVTDHDLRRDFARVCESLAVSVGGSRDAVQNVVGSPDLERWEAILLTRRAWMATEYGGDDDALELVDDMLDRYRGWLRFLFATAGAAPAAPAGAVVAVAATAVPPLEALLAVPYRVWVHCVGPCGALLESEAVRRLILAAVDRGEPPSA